MRIRMVTLLLAMPFWAFAAEPNQLSTEEKTAGWILLFDGQTPKGWHTFHKHSFPDHGWTVADGWLHGLGKGGGDVLSDGEFDQFELQWEWKLAPGGNSGLDVTAEGPEQVQQSKSVVGHGGMDEVLVAVAPPEGNQRRRAGGGDIQGREGMALQHFIPFKVLDYSAILDFDGIQCHFVTGNRAGGHDMSRSSGHRYKCVERRA